MPIPLAIAGAAIGQAGNMQQNYMNAVSTSAENYVNRRWSERMYQRQFNDNVAFWRMQNDYNSPSQQMARFQQAGLNPNLIYGQGNSGNAGPINTPDIQPYSYRSPEFNAGASPLSIMGAMADLEIKQAQANNLKAQNTILLQDALLRNVQTKRAQFDLDFESELRPYSADYRRERVRQIKQQTDFSFDENERRALLTAKSVDEAYERILNYREQRKGMPLERERTRQDTERLRQTIEGLKKDNVTKDLDNELRRAGINPNDPMWARIVGRFLNNAYEGDGFQITTGNIWESIYNYMFND